MWESGCEISYGISRMNPYKKGCDGMMKVRSPICRVENKGRVGVVSIDGINIVQDFEEKKFRKTEKN